MQCRNSLVFMFLHLTRALSLWILCTNFGLLCFSWSRYTIILATEVILLPKQYVPKHFVVELSKDKTSSHFTSYGYYSSNSNLEMLGLICRNFWWGRMRFFSRADGCMMHFIALSEKSFVMCICNAF